MSERQRSVFISYSHKDEEWKDRLVQHLSVLGDESGFDVWDDRRIGGGQDWKAEIERAILAADVAVLLVSVDFLTSDFIKREEVARLLRLREDRRLTILPVIVGACPWRRVGWLSAIQARPRDGAPLEGMPKAGWNAALASIAEEIDAVLAQGAKDAERGRARGASPEGSEAARAVQPASESVEPSARPSPPHSDAPKSTPAPPAQQTARVESRPPDIPQPERQQAQVAQAGQQAAPSVEPSARPSPRHSDAPKPTPAPSAQQTAVAPAAPVPAPKRAIVAKAPTEVGVWRRSLTSLLRAATRSLPVWLMGVTGLALGLYIWMRASAASSSPSPVPGLAFTPPPQRISMAAFEFDTATVDARGAVVERKRGSAQIYEEDLGDGVKLAMVAIPGGQFVMGSPTNEADRGADEGPQRTVTVAPFFLGQFEVTQAQWRAVARWRQVSRTLAEAPSRFKGDDLPVEHVSWDDAVEFCARLSRRTGRTYRLPSEAEWEYAARAGTTTPFHFGATITPALANYGGDFLYAVAAKGEYRQGTTPVGSFKVGNAFGLFDMHGNVWEWTLDVWHDGYAGAPTDGSAWEAGGDRSRRVVRGGSWLGHATYCRSASRALSHTDGRDGNVGFRVLCSVARTR